MEIWKDIKGYKGLYQISNLGRVKSLGRYQKVKLNNNVNKAYRPERILKHGKDLSGYFHVCLAKNSKGKTKQIHKLVALHFISNFKNKKQVNHKDGIKINNTVENLEWCTYHENLKHAIDNGLRATCEKHGATKLKNEDVLRIRELYAKGLRTIKELAKIYNIGNSTTEQIISRRYWKTI